MILRLLNNNSLIAFNFFTILDINIQGNQDAVMVAPIFEYHGITITCILYNLQ